MEIVNPFYTSIQTEHDLIQTNIKSLVLQSSDTLSSYWNSIFSSSGKLIRSAFLLYTAKIINHLDIETIHCGMVVELIHQASLIHDDVVDQSDTRRGQKSINALWGNAIAVLIGDQLFTFAMDTATDTPKSAQKTITRACRLVTEAEILQHKSTFSNSRENYYKIIEGKTGALFAAACSMAAICANESEEEIEKWWNFGLLCGTIFQIRDDILDFLPESTTGKPSFMDLTNQKITLPILKVLETMNSEERVLFMERLQHFSKEDTQWLNDILHKTQAMNHTQNEIQKLTQKALNFLNSYPKNAANHDLQNLILHLSQPVFN